MPVAERRHCSRLLRFKGSIIVDLNHLHHREGVERMRADGAACTASRHAHLGLAGIFRARIDGLRRARVAAARPVLVPAAL